MKKANKLKITSDARSENLRIYFNGILHVCVIIKNLQVNSWKKSNDWYIIELHTMNGIVELEYNSMFKWEAVLKILDETI